MLSNRTKIILKINHFQVFNFFYPIKITIQFENWCLLFRTILYSSHYFWIKKHFQGQSNYFLNITPYINMQLIDGSVVRSNHMIGFNQSGHLCCLLAFGGRLIVWGHQRARWSRGVRRVFRYFPRFRAKHGMCNGTKNRRPAQNGLYGNRERIAH